jgi:hypothetical protein
MVPPDIELGEDDEEDPADQVEAELQGEPNNGDNGKLRVMHHSLPRLVMIWSQYSWLIWLHRLHCWRPCTILPEVKWHNSEMNLPPAGHRRSGLEAM